MREGRMRFWLWCAAVWAAGVIAAIVGSFAG